MLISIFLGTLLLVGYTSVLEIIPAYRTEADRARDGLIVNIQRIDSMERIMNDMALYADNVGLILEGKTPVARTAIVSDTIKYQRDFTPSNAADSALRAQMEGEGEYALSNIAPSQVQPAPTINYTAPIDGVIIDKFDIKNGSFGVRIAADPEANITAVEDGVVMQVLWNPDSGTIVEILHPNNVISIYKNLSKSTVSRGEAVQEGQVIGYNAKAVKDSAAEQVFDFEMWSESKPTNPERFIIF